MAFKVNFRQLVDAQKRPTGRWRMTIASDVDDAEGPLCNCDAGPGLPGHASKRAARDCNVARQRLKIEPYKGRVRLPRAPREAKPTAPNTTAPPGAERPPTP